MRSLVSGWFRKGILSCSQLWLEDKSHTWSVTDLLEVNSG